MILGYMADRAKVSIETVATEGMVYLVLYSSIFFSWYCPAFEFENVEKI
jgi:hypothetical protein